MCVGLTFVRYQNTVQVRCRVAAYPVVCRRKRVKLTAFVTSAENPSGMLIFRANCPPASCHQGVKLACLNALAHLSTVGMHHAYTNLTPDFNSHQEINHDRT
jgi:hypothetical protein